MKLDTRQLDKLIRQLKKDPPILKVGVIGDKGARNSKTKTTNATIGAKHEMGIDVAQRSWLRMPLIEHFEKYLAKSGAFGVKSFEIVLKTGSLAPWLAKAGIVAESVIGDAFDTGGFGKWAKWRGGYTNRTGKILVDTQQLRNSVTSQVDGK